MSTRFPEFNDFIKIHFVSDKVSEKKTPCNKFDSKIEGHVSFNICVLFIK